MYAEHNTDNNVNPFPSCVFPPCHRTQAGLSERAACAAAGPPLCSGHPHGGKLFFQTCAVNQHYKYL